MKQVDENAYNQMSVVLIIKLAALKLHEFSVQSIDEFFKIYEKVLIYCNNQDLLMIILDISESLILKENEPNPLGVQVKLRIEKKQMIAQRIIKRTVRMTREENSQQSLQDRMQKIITHFLLSYNL